MSRCYLLLSTIVVVLLMHNAQGKPLDTGHTQDSQTGEAGFVASLNFYTVKTCV